MSDWSKVSRKDVIKAIEIFDKEKPQYTKPTTTLLIYNNIVYPGKKIAKMAYYIVHGVEPDLKGGRETINIFEKLGFDTYWKTRDEEIPEYEIQMLNMKNKSARKNSKKHFNIPIENSMLDTSYKYQKIKIPHKKGEMRQQKEYLQNLLYELFGEVETEKKYDWATSPRTEKVYMDIIANIEKLCGTRSFANKKYKMAFDFVCEKQKLIIEYDERQHFTKQRKIALMSYPSNIRLYYEKKMWIKACDDINTRLKSKDRPYRDETRAFYESIRDIESYRNGYRLIRIMHGQFDFSRDDAKGYLLELIGD